MVSIDEFVIVIRADTSEASEALRTLNANTSALNRTMDDYQRGFEALQEAVELLGDTEVNISPNFDGGDTKTTNR
jgi:exonuclease VII small subunit